jgi:SAM-dependent methyltransferase
MVDEQLKDVVRIGFNIGLALQSARRAAPSELEICDLGGGVGLFSVGCAALGLKRTVLVDDFGDSVSHRAGPSILDLHRRYRVEVVSRDVVAGGMRGIGGGFDVITTFDSMEHWHHSPKRLFGEVVEKLNPRGAFVLGVPNCVNLRKRITVPFGIGKWTRIQDWYDAEVFRGHVREPDVSDLKYIARDLGLVDVEIVGRNWAGYASGSRLVRLATRLTDHPLRLKPSLCADIYLVGRKA